MMQSEFIEQLNEYAGPEKVRQFTDGEYTRIEYVYTWHPTIKAVGGKRQIAMLWQEFGMGMINDMYAKAQEMEALESRRIILRKDLHDIETEIKK